MCSSTVFMATINAKSCFNSRPGRVVGKDNLQLSLLSSFEHMNWYEPENLELGDPKQSTDSPLEYAIKHGKTNGNP